MSQSASQASAFYEQVAKDRSVWTIKDANGFPAPATLSGARAMPFWSSRSRVERVIETDPAYRYFEPVNVSWDEFLAKWIPGLEADGLLVGVNWSGPRATGYDLEPDKLVRAVEFAIKRHNGETGPSDDSAEPEFERFEDLTRKLLDVSKRELDEKRNGG
jgi:hypothetical protein